MCPYTKNITPESMKKILLSLCALTIAVANAQDLKSDITKYVKSQLPTHEKLYVQLHQAPELSNQEKNTSATIAAELRKLGFEVHEQVAGYSVVGILRNGEGRTIMLRTDMDALPVQEATGLPFASTVRAIDPLGVEQPVFHACGHDVHMTTWLGTLASLVEFRKEWKGTIMAVAQSAEEINVGAKALIEAGLFTKFGVTPDYNLAYHVESAHPTGSIAYTIGPAMAGLHNFDVTIRGVGGHGAMPATTIDPIVLTAQVIMAYQTIVSRNVSALDAATVTVGSIHGGQKHNIIPDEVKMQLTTRFYDTAINKLTVRRLEEITLNTARAAGVPENLLPTITPIDEARNPVVNDEKLTLSVVDGMKAILGDDKVYATRPHAASEDFTYYGSTDERIPSALLFLGVGESAALHNPRFKPDFPDAYITGASAMSYAMMQLFNITL